MSVLQELDQLLHDPTLVSLVVDHPWVVAKLLGENTTREHLCHTTGDYMGRALATALKENSSLQSFQLACGGTSMSDDTGTALATALKENTSLRVFECEAPRWAHHLPIAESLLRNRQFPVH